MPNQIEHPCDGRDARAQRLAVDQDLARHLRGFALPCLHRRVDDLFQRGLQYPQHFRIPALFLRLADQRDYRDTTGMRHLLSEHADLQEEIGRKVEAWRLRRADRAVDERKVQVRSGRSRFPEELFPSAVVGQRQVSRLVASLTGPSSSPNVRGVCIGARFANIENVLQRSCTDPAQ